MPDTKSLEKLFDFAVDIIYTPLHSSVSHVRKAEPLRNVHIIIERIEFNYDIALNGSYSECRGATVHALVKKRNGTSVSMKFWLPDYSPLHDHLGVLAEVEWESLVGK